VILRRRRAARKAMANVARFNGAHRPKRPHPRIRS
jgi:hypothetical protein